MLSLKLPYTAIPSIGVDVLVESLKVKLKSSFQLTFFILAEIFGLEEIHNDRTRLWALDNK